MKSLVLAVLLLGAGVAEAKGRNPYQAQIGNTEADLVLTLGAPSKTWENDETKILTYIRAKQGSGMMMPVGNMAFMAYDDKPEIVSFAVSKATGKVTAWRKN